MVFILGHQTGGFGLNRHDEESNLPSGYNMTNIAMENHNF